MEVIKSNPFRTLDLPASASDRLITKKAHKLRLAVEMGTATRVNRLSSYYIDFELTFDAIHEAENRLHRPSDRFLYSLFANTGGYGSLLDQGEEIDKQNSKKFSSIFNQVDLYLNDLIAAFTTSGVKISHLLEATSKAGQLYSSQLFGDYYEHIGARIQWMDSVYTVFSNSIIFALQNTAGPSVPLGDVMISLSTFPDNGYQLISNQILDSICDPIEVSIKSNQISRKQSPEQGLEIAETLIALNEKYLELLNKLDQNTWPKAVLVINHLCAEIFQSSIDFFNITIKTRPLNVDELKKSIAVELIAYKYVIDENLQDKLFDSIKASEDAIREFQDFEKNRHIMQDDSAMNVKLTGRSGSYSYWTVCVCCLKPTERMHKWTAEKSSGNSKQTKDVSFPYCEECENHDNELKSKRIIFIFVILLLIGVLAFLLGMVGMPVIIGIIFGIISGFSLYVIAKDNQRPKWATTLNPITAEHAHRGFPLKILNFDQFSTTIQFMNPIYAQKFAEMNNVQTVGPIKVKKYPKGINILEGRSGGQIVLWSTIGGAILAAVCANFGLEARGSSPSDHVVPPGYSGPTTLPNIGAPATATSPAYVPPPDTSPSPPSPNSYLRSAERQRIEGMKAQLATMEFSLTSERSELESIQEQINSSNARLVYLRQINDISTYNLEVDNHNLLLSDYRSKQSDFNAKVARHNRLLAETNAAVDTYNRGN